MNAVRLECHECGGSDCATRGEETRATWIVCRGCGAKLITFGQLHDEIARQAREYATRSIRSSLAISASLQDNDIVSPGAETRR